MTHAQTPTAADTEESASRELFYFVDAPTDGPTTPSAQSLVASDVVHEYTAQLADPGNAIVIDNGSCWCRTGWSSEDEPRLIFRNILAKPKMSKDQPVVVSVGNAIPNFDSMRSYLKTPFERNVVVNFDLEEHVFDYIFNRLGINTVGSVNHPIVVSECVWNPLYSRKCMSELLFEAYQVPGVCYAVDALGALYNFKNNDNKSNSSHASQANTCLVVSIGSNNTHIVPVINGVTQWDDVRRITLGGSNLVYYMQRLLQLKYPHHWSTISLIRAEKLVHKFAYFADDYLEELRRWREDPAYAENQTITAQLPFSAVKQQDLTAAKKDAEERHRKNAERLREMARQNRMQRVAESEVQLRDLHYAARIFTECRAAESDENALIISNTADDAENDSATLATSKRVLTDEERDEKMQQAKQILYNYGVTEADLGSHTKRLEVSLKRTRDKLQQAAAGTLSDNKKPSKVIEAPPEGEERIAWLNNMRRQRTDLIQKREKRRQRREQLSTRGSYAAQQRMKIITQLASNKKAKLNASNSAANADAKNAADDNFGRNDSDWAVYREINLDAGDSESEEEREQLSKIEDSLYEYDDEFRRQQKDGFVDENSAEFYQLRVGTERFRCAEILFQPDIVGIDQRGLCEAIQFVIGRYDAATQTALATNVLVTGSATAVPGLRERIEKELISWRPFQSSVKVKLMPTCNSNSDGVGGALDAWKGMAQWVRDGNLTAKVEEDGKSALVTRQMYEEMGHDYLSEHALANKWVRRKEKLGQTGVSSS